MDVAALAADYAVAGGRHPFDVEHGRQTAVQLCLAAIEGSVIADEAAERSIVHVDDLWLFLAEDGHATC